MTEPSSPDLSFSALLAALDDNNSGAITPEDVRSVAALSRPSIATIGAATVGGPDSDALKNLFTTETVLPSTLANGSVTTKYAILPQLLDAAGATFYNHSTGHMGLSRSATTTKALGLRYNNPGSSPQPRVFHYEWDFVLESSAQTFWALTFFYLPSGTGWPTAGTGSGASNWSSIKIHHSEPVYGDKERTVNGDAKWQASSTGSKTIVLNSGDTIVPVLEYWGLATGDTPDITTQDGLLKKWAFTAASEGVTTTEWANDYNDYWTIESNRDKTQYILGDRATIAAPTEQSLFVKVCTSTTRPAAAVGQMIYETDTGKSLVYINSTLGWSQAWNQPWGKVGTQTDPPSGGPGYPAGGADGAPEATGFSIAVPMVKGRRYRITAQGHAYSPDNTENMTLSGDFSTGTGSHTIAGGGYYSPSNGSILAITSGTSWTSDSFAATGAGAGTVSLYETQTAGIYVYQGAAIVARTSIQHNKTYANGFNLDFVYTATATSTTTFTLAVGKDEGDDPQYVFHSPTTDRPVVLLAEDLGPADGQIPPTS